jgi:S-formylglutathione hydrolase
MRLGLLVLLLWTPVFAQNGKVDWIQVRGASLEGNLEGDSPVRDVAVYLPPSYAAAATRRYPVVYLLHGFTDNTDQWWGKRKHFVSVPEVADRALSAGVREMIIVMPNAFTRYQGSMYSNSATTGNWEKYVAEELVAYIDRNYRTLANRSGRGLAGHSMGGYGTIRIGMKYPEVFSSLYLLSPCCMAPSTGIRLTDKIESITSPEEVAKADFFTKAMFASAAAWSPNPNNPPLFLDLPVKNGEMQPRILAKWTANAPLAMIDQYVYNLRRYQGLGMDAGTKDQPIARTVETLHNILDSYRIKHFFELYEGDHVNRVAERLEKHVLPFFDANFAK